MKSHLNRSITIFFCAIALSLPANVIAQDTQTLFRALVKLETSVDEVESSLKQIIEDKVKSQQDLIGEHKVMIGEQQNTLASMQKELAALKSQVKGQRSGAGQSSDKTYKELESQVEFLKRSMLKLSESQQKLLHQLNGISTQPASNPTSQEDLLQKYNHLSDRLNSVVMELKTALEDERTSKQASIEAKRVEEETAEKETAEKMAESAKVDKFSVDGYLRFRGNSYVNYDLNAGSQQDNLNDFITVRSFVNMHVQQNKIKALLSLNLAGSEFDDGFFWGNDNPAQVRNWNASIQYLYLDYTGAVKVRAGRMPAGFGNGIVAHTTRDGIKVSKKIDKFAIAAVWFKGGEGISTAGIQDASLEVVNDSTGSDHDLDAVVIPMMYFYAPKSRLQFVIARLFDSRADEGFPEKMFLNLNVIGQASDFSYAAEIALLRGETPFNAAMGRRLDYNAHMIFLKGVRRFGQFSFGSVFGTGSGDKDPTDTQVQNFQNLFMDETGYHFTHLFSDDLHGYTGENKDLGKGSGFGNVTFYQLFGSVRPSNKVEISLSGTIMRTTEPRDLGTGIYGTNISDDVTHDIGQEFDASARIHLTEQSQLLFSGAVFFPGDIYQGRDTAYKLETGIAVTF